MKKKEPKQRFEKQETKRRQFWAREAVPIAAWKAQKAERGPTRYGQNQT